MSPLIKKILILLGVSIFLYLTFRQKGKRYRPILAIAGPFYAWKQKDKRMYQFFLITNIFISLFLIFAALVEISNLKYLDFSQKLYYIFMVICVAQFIAAFYQFLKISKRYKNP